MHNFGNILKINYLKIVKYNVKNTYNLCYETFLKK